MAINVVLLGATCCRGGEDLTTAWQAALAANSRLAAAEYEHQAAEFDVSATRSQRLPTATLQGGYEVRTEERNFLIDSPLLPAPFSAPYRQREASFTTASVELPIYTFGRISNGIQSSEAEAAAAKFRLATARLDLFLAVGGAYINVLRRERSLEVADRHLAWMLAYQSDVAHRFSQHQVARTDVLAAEVAAAEATQARLAASFELDAARFNYNRLLGRPLESPVQLLEIAMPPLPYDLLQLRECAFCNRPDLHELQASSDAMNFKADQLRASNRPQLGVVGRYDFEENRFQTPQAISSAGIVVDWSPYDGGANSRLASASEARGAALRKLQDDRKAQIAMELSVLWNRCNEATARVRVTQAALAHAEEILRVAELRLTSGTQVDSAVREAQSRRAESANVHYQSGYDVLDAQLRLRHVAGVLGQEVGVCVPQ